MLSYKRIRSDLARILVWGLKPIRLHFTSTLFPFLNWSHSIINPFIKWAWFYLEGGGLSDP